MTGDALIWLPLVALALACLASIGSRALRDFSRSDLQEVCERNALRERFGEIVRRHETVALGVEIIGALATALFVGGVVAVVAQGSAEDASGQSTTLLAALAAGVVLAGLRVGVPWSVARLYAEPFLFHTWPFWRLMGAVATPLSAAVRFVDAMLHRLAGQEPEAPDEETIEEEIRTIVTEGHREGLLEEDAREMIEGVIELGDADVSQIMTPRTDMHMIHVDLAWDEMLEDVIQAGHTRIPVYDKTRDDLVGVLYVKDLLPELAKKEPDQRNSMRDLARKPIFVPGTKAVDDLLEMFQHERTHIAIVLDEYGGVSGLVTIEDALEEIVGEIVDEYDADQEEPIQEIGDGVIEAEGRVHVDEVNERLGLSLPEDRDFDTIGGFVFAELGRVPAVGEEVVWRQSARVTVTEATRRRIERVRVERLAKPSAESA